MTMSTKPNRHDYLSLPKSLPAAFHEDRFKLCMKICVCGWMGTGCVQCIHMCHACMYNESSWNWCNHLAVECLNAVREYSVHSACLAMFSVTFVCVCLKNAHLHTYRSSIHMKRVHASSFTALYMNVCHQTMMCLLDLLSLQRLLFP